MQNQQKLKYETNAAPENNVDLKHYKSFKYYNHFAHFIVFKYNTSYFLLLRVKILWFT